MKKITYFTRFFVSVYLLFILFVTIGITNSFAQPGGYAWDRFGQGAVTLTNNSPVNGILSNTTVATGASTYYLVEWNSYADKWSNTSTPYNQVFTLTWGGGSSNGANGVLSNATVSGKYYTLQIEGLDYSNRSAVLMVTDNSPIGFDGSTPITYSSAVYPGQDLTVTVNLAGAKSAQEKVFIRYSTDSFSSSQVAEVSFSTGTASTGTATIPASVNTAGASVLFYAYSTTVAANNSSNHDLITLKLSNKSGSNYSYTVENNWITTGGATNWSASSSWAGGAEPTSGQPIVIDHDLTLDKNITASSITINAEKTLTVSGAQTLTISDGGTLTNNGTFTAGTGKVAFAGGGTVSGTIAFNNVDLSGSVNFGSSSTVNGELKLLSGSSLNTNKPTYGSSSTLTYNTGGDYGAGIEWPTGADGAPNNVKIVDSSVNFGSADANRYILNDLTIQTDGTLTLSTVIGGDLRIRGDWSNSGTFASNNRAVFFDGSTAQTIENTTDSAIEIPYLFIQNNVTANSNLTVASTLDIAADKTLTILSGNALLTPASGVEYKTNGKIEFQRTLTSPTYGSLPEGETGHWVGLSTPVSGGTFAGTGGLLEEIWTQGFTGADDTGGDPNVIVYDTSVPGFAAPSSNTMTTGQGFAVYLYKNKDRDDDGTAVDYSSPFNIIGSENTFSSSNYSFTVSNNGSGWNFLGNPFGASLDWKSGSWTKTNIGEFMYLWNPSTSKYKISDGGTLGNPNIEGVLSAADSKIAPFQAFWVKTTAADPVLTVNAAARTITSPNAGLFDDSNSSESDGTGSTPILSLNLELEDDMTSITAFRFGEEYATTFSGNDAYYLSPFGRSFAYLFSYLDETPALLKSLPLQSEEPIVIPLSVGGYSDLNYYSGEATLSRHQFDNIPASWDITLYDSHTDTEIDLRAMESYSFTLNPSNKSTGATSMFDLMKDDSPVINTALTNPNKGVTRFSLIISNDVPTSINPADELPTEIALAQNYPNPFNPATSISFELPQSQSLTLDVYDTSGRHIATLASGMHQAGSHTVNFDASGLSSGVYFYRLQTENATLTRKFTLLK